MVPKHEPALPTGSDTAAKFNLADCSFLVGQKITSTGPHGTEIEVIMSEVLQPSDRKNRPDLMQQRPVTKQDDFKPTTTAIKRVTGVLYSQNITEQGSFSSH